MGQVGSSQGQVKTIRVEDLRITVKDAPVLPVPGGLHVHCKTLLMLSIWAHRRRMRTSPRTRAALGR